MKLLKSTQILFFLVITMSLFGQQSPQKFGKIKVEDLKQSICPIDSSANAYYLFDFGVTYFEYAATTVSSNSAYNTNKGFQLYYTRHYRIKVVNKDGLSFGDIRLVLYNDGENNKEDLTSIKANTYNLVNGKIVKSKVSRKNIFMEKTNNRFTTAKFAMPAVKEGSIIEIEYTIKSDFLYNLQKWQVQYAIPNLCSEYYVTIPEYFKYNQTHRGYYLINTEKTNRPKQITITYKQEAEGISVQAETYTKTLDFNEVTYHYNAENIPGFPNEPYLRTKENYISRIEFELERTQFPYAREKYFTTTWDEVDKTMIESSYFGKELANSNHLQTDAQEIATISTDQTTLANNALEFVKKKMVWNNIASRYTTESLKKSYTNGSGNCADINLNLVLMLRELGITSYPVMLSTQDNGIIHPSHPSISRFNYVIAMSVIDDKVCLLDATDPNAELNLLPLRCLNDKGRIIGDVPEKWINLMDYKPLVEISQYKLTLDDEMLISGEGQKKFIDYGAYQMRKNILDYKTVDEYIAAQKGKDGKLHISNIKIDNLHTSNTPLEVSFNITKTKLANKTGDMVYFSPTLNPYFDKNPFKLELREFPVEFNHPYQIQQIYTYKIPDSYEVVEFPKPLMANLSDKSAMVIFNSTNNGNMLTISYTIIIKRSVFLTTEYANLKALFQMFISKQNEMVVLKKKL